MKLYATAGCTGTPAATGSATAFGAPGLTATVVLGSTTTFRATATDAAGNTSACSTSAVTYTSDLSDGGFEAATGNPANSPFWAESDSLAGTPLCTVATCTPGPEIAPHAGNAWAWFGGFADAGHTGSLAQRRDHPCRQRRPDLLVPEQLGDRAVRRDAAGPGRRDDRADPHRGLRCGRGVQPAGRRPGAVRGRREPPPVVQLRERGGGRQQHAGGRRRPEPRVGPAHRRRRPSPPRAGLPVDLDDAEGDRCRRGRLDGDPPRQQHVHQRRLGDRVRGRVRADRDHRDACRRRRRPPSTRRRSRRDRTTPPARRPS